VFGLGLATRIYRRRRVLVDRHQVVGLSSIPGAAFQELFDQRPTVLRWRQDFEQAGLDGLLEGTPRTRRKGRLRPEREEAIVNTTLYRKPPGAKPGSVRTLG
jgi:hypothetical protein